MDTVVEEENSNPPSPTTNHHADDQFLTPNIVVYGPGDETSPNISRNASRRPSFIIEALRRPSQALALSAAHAFLNHKRTALSIYHGEKCETQRETEMDDLVRLQNKKIEDDLLTTVLSALYAKLLVVLGIAFPITEIVAPSVKQFYYRGFYLYLYLVSIAYVTYMYITMVYNKRVPVVNFSGVAKSFDRLDDKNHSQNECDSKKEVIRYGSFYLRLGAIAFGIGSMVHTGLEFGSYFEMKNDNDCLVTVLQAITPVTRMILTLIQIQFIFLNGKQVEIKRHKIIARFGLMHMIATNLCEWLYVIVEETKHEIVHMAAHDNSSHFEAKYCQEGKVMGSLVANASPFLFPCTIEYSLICAVILFEMWKRVKRVTIAAPAPATNIKSKLPLQSYERITTLFQFPPFGGPAKQSNHHFTIDCSNSHKGLFGGILTIVVTIISLIMFFVLTKTGNRSFAQLEVNIVEMILHIVTIGAVIASVMKLRDMKYDKKLIEGHSGMELDTTLLVVAQSGVFIYCVFSIIGSYFSSSSQSIASLLAEVTSFVQACLQTLFVLDGWWRRCRNVEQAKRQPARELITFLIVANMALWTINALEKNHAEFRPAHLKFYGNWAWTIITHISMPLAIFYRFHSTICLFEIWKSAYKIKEPFNSSASPLD